MNFASFHFLAFFLVVALLRVTIGRRKVEPLYLGSLLVLSLVFYMWHVPAYVLILLASTVVDYFCGRRIHSQGESPQGTRARRFYLVVSLATNLGMLGVFKYAGYFSELAGDLLELVGRDPSSAPHWEILLPMGISFYTFQSMSYTIDIYRGQLAPSRSFWRFLLFVSFFPQIVAGPIVRARDFLYQIDRPRSLNAKVALEGVHLIVRGFFLKVCLADNLAALVDSAWWTAATPAGDLVQVATVVVLFSFQIFCDFAGYSSIARGLAYLLGFRLPVNFDYPYIACSFSEFWRRWHISLSTWLRDYLYIPLGGNRGSKPRTYRNLMLVMLLGGLWHGAASHFVIWGAIHGTALAIERLLSDRALFTRSVSLPAFVRFLIVQAVVLLAWLFFRASSGSQVLDMLANAASIKAGSFRPDIVMAGLIYVIPAVLMHARAAVIQRMGVWRVGLREEAFWTAVMLYCVVVGYGRGSDFIYFQF